MICSQKSDLKNNVEHHLSTIKIEKNVRNPINVLTEKGHIRQKVSRWVQTMNKTLL